MTKKFMTFILGAILLLQGRVVFADTFQSSWSACTMASAMVDEMGSCGNSAIDELLSQTTINENSDGSYTYTLPNGDTFSIDISGGLANLSSTDITNIVNAFDFSQLNSTQVQDIANSLVGDATALAALMSAIGTDTFVYNNDATWTHTALDGTTVVLDFNAAFDDLTPAGATALMAALDFSQLSSTQVQDIVNSLAGNPAALAALLGALGSDDLSYGNNAIWTHVELDGDVVLIDLNTALADLNSTGLANFNALVASALSTGVISTISNDAGNDIVLGADGLPFYDDVDTAVSTTYTPGGVTGVSNVQDAIDAIATQNSLDLDTIADAFTSAASTIINSGTADSLNLDVNFSASSFQQGVHDSLTAHYGSNLTDLAAMQALINTDTDTRVVPSFQDTDADSVNDVIRFEVFAVDPATGNTTGPALSAVDMFLSSFIAGTFDMGVDSFTSSDNSILNSGTADNLNLVADPTNFNWASGDIPLLALPSGSDTKVDIDPLIDNNVWTAGDTIVVENAAGTEEEADLAAKLNSAIGNPASGVAASISAINGNVPKHGFYSTGNFGAFPTATGVFDKLTLPTSQAGDIFLVSNNEYTVPETGTYEIKAQGSLYWAPGETTPTRYYLSIAKNGSIISLGGEAGAAGVTAVSGGINRWVSSSLKIPLNQTETITVVGYSLDNDAPTLVQYAAFSIEMVQ